MQLENQAHLITFYLESLNLLDRIKLNLEVLYQGFLTRGKFVYPGG